MKNQDNFDEKLPQEEVASHSHIKEKNKKTKLIILILACLLVFAVIATIIFGVFYIKGILKIEDFDKLPSPDKEYLEIFKGFITYRFFFNK